MKKVKFVIVLMLTCFSLTVVAQDTAEKPAKKEKVKVEKPFTVHDKSTKVTRVDVRKDLKGQENVVQIDAVNAAGGTSLVSTSVPMPPAVISNVNIVQGNYNQTRDLQRRPGG